MEEENSYFKAVVKDALSDLKHKKNACVFYEEQVKAIMQHFFLFVKKIKH